MKQDTSEHLTVVVLRVVVLSRWEDGFNLLEREACDRVAVAIELFSRCIVRALWEAARFQTHAIKMELEMMKRVGESVGFVTLILTWWHVLGVYVAVVVSLNVSMPALTVCCQTLSVV